MPEDFEMAKELNTILKRLEAEEGEPLHLTVSGIEKNLVDIGDFRKRPIVVTARPDLIGYLKKDSELIAGEYTTFGHLEKRVFDLNLPLNNSIVEWRRNNLLLLDKFEKYFLEQAKEKGVFETMWGKYKKLKEECPPGISEEEHCVNTILWNTIDVLTMRQICHRNYGFDPEEPNLRKRTESRLKHYIGDVNFFNLEFLKGFRRLLEENNIDYFKGLVEVHSEGICDRVGYLKSGESPIKTGERIGIPGKDLHWMDWNPRTRCDNQSQMGVIIADMRYKLLSEVEKQDAK